MKQNPLDLGSFGRRVRLVRAWRGLAVGLLVGGALGLGGEVGMGGHGRRLRLRLQLRLGGGRGPGGCPGRRRNPGGGRCFWGRFGGGGGGGFGLSGAFRVAW